MNDRNHYHLLARQRVTGGITEFLRKLGTGYTNYFNLRHERVGPLFQGKFKAAFLKDEANFLHLPNYIHANPLELFAATEDEVFSDFSREGMLKKNVPIPFSETTSAFRHSRR